MRPPDERDRSARDGIREGPRLERSVSVLDRHGDRGQKCDARAGRDHLRKRWQARRTEIELVRARRVFNCTYSRINHLLQSSGLPLIPLTILGGKLSKKGKS